MWNVRYSFVLVVLHCNYYPYLTHLWPEIRKMISDNSSLHASSNTGYHSYSNGSWRNAPEVFLCTERPEETDWQFWCQRMSVTVTVIYTISHVVWSPQKRNFCMIIIFRDWESIKNMNKKRTFWKHSTVYLVGQLRLPPSLQGFSKIC